MSDWGGSVGTKQVVVTWTFLFLAFVVLLLRVITRVKVLKNFGLEDYVLCTAFVCTIACLFDQIGLANSYIRLSLSFMRLSLWLVRSLYASRPSSTLLLTFFFL